MAQTKKHFGQHFLTNSAIILQIIHTIDPKADDCMLEIGPGHGAITADLLEFVNHLFAVEIDRDCIVQLEKQFSNSRLSLFHQDILNFSLDEIDAKKKIRVVGNLPYNISTPLLFHLYRQKQNIEDMHFMLQKEVAERICAKTSDRSYSRLSIMSQLFCEVEYLFEIDSHCFDPPPKVQSAFIRLIPRTSMPMVNTSLLNKVVTAAFNMRRKTIANSLKNHVSCNELEQLGVNPKLRPQNLSIDDYIRITNYYETQGNE